MKYQIKLTLGNETYESIIIDANEDEYEYDRKMIETFGSIDTLTFPVKNGFMAFPKELLQRSYIEFIDVN